MENTQNRNDALKFFESMTTEEQKRAITYLQKIIKKPPDLSFENTPEIKSNSKELTLERV